MKFKKFTNASSPKMGLLRNSSGENKTSNFKRSKSLRASVKLMTKIRTHPYISTRTENSQKKINSISSKDEEHVQSMSRLRLSCDLGVNLTEGSEKLSKVTEDLEAKDSRKHSSNDNSVLKGKINEGGVVIRNDQLESYENFAFSDNSFDSITDSFYHGNELHYLEKQCDSEMCQKTPQKVFNAQNDQGITVVMKNEPICKAHEWCTRVKIPSAKQFFQSSKKYKNIFDGQDENTYLNLEVPRNRPISSVSNETKELPLKTSNKIQQRKKESIERRCMDFEVRNISRQILHGNTIDTKAQSSQAMEFLEGLGRRKALQRNVYQHDKLSSASANSIILQSSYDIHLHVLFTAIEQGYVDRVRAILESAEIEINSLNTDGFSPLDVAVLNNNRLLTKMLITFGAQEGNQFNSPDGVKNHLLLLLTECERRLQELGGSITSSGFSGMPLLEPSSSHTPRGSFSSQHGNLTGCGGSAEEKQLASWERRARVLKKMLMIVEQTGPPDMPSLVTVDVTGTTSVTVKFHESDLPESPMCTKFKLQWSFSEDFSEACGEKDILDMKSKECLVEDLVQGRKYFFRAAAGNIKGYSQFKSTNPPSVIPSSWRDLDGRIGRFEGRLEQLDNLFRDVRGPEFCHEAPALQRRNHKKKTTIKQLFTASSKFQKNLRRGIFLSCVLYHEDKILVTNEDFLPVIEIDETYPSLIHQDFHWLMKVACSWDDVKTLKQDMEKSQGSSTNHFRIKMLQAATQMQTALCIQDLGQLYHKPIRDAHGTVVLSSVNHVRSSKLVSMLNSRWLPLSKIIKKLSVHEESHVAEILMASIQEQVKYHQASSLQLPRGLYLGYFKLQSSVDSIQVVVPAKSPNILPHCKVRDNPHVTAEEWEHLGRLAQAGDEAEGPRRGSEQQRLFAEALASAARRLFGYMELSAEEARSHRVYAAEVIELSGEASLLVVVPPFESACSPPGSRELLLQRGDLLSLPVQVFEVIHFGTYQREVTARYLRLSCILELDAARARHSQREAFSSSELALARERLERLRDWQARAGALWKGARWLIDVITFARDRTSAGVGVRRLPSPERGRGQPSCHSLKRSLLQLPPRDPKLVKASPGRGSWPGPGASDSACGADLGLLGAELSKSEQRLPGPPGPCSRKGSAGSQCSSASEPLVAPPAPPARAPPGLPASRSEGVLALGGYRLLDAARCAGPGQPAASVAAVAAERKPADSQAEEGALLPLLPGILQVYAAYETGLASGTSLKLHVTPRTTAREVVDLVVKQLNMAVVLKGLEGPVYPADELANFCLVAVIGARERCLRDDFKPLQLQNPWKKGRLYVRQKQDVLAALEHSSKHSAYL